MISCKQLAGKIGLPIPIFIKLITGENIDSLSVIQLENVIPFIGNEIDFKYDNDLKMFDISPEEIRRLVVLANRHCVQLNKCVREYESYNGLFNREYLVQHLNIPVSVQGVLTKKRMTGEFLHVCCTNVEETTDQILVAEHIWIQVPSEFPKNYYYCFDSDVIISFIGTPTRYYHKQQQKYSLENVYDLKIEFIPYEIVEKYNLKNKLENNKIKQWFSNQCLELM